MRRKLIIAAIATGLFAGGATAQMGGPGMGGMGFGPTGNGLSRNMMGGIPGYGMDLGIYSPGMLDALGLSDAQRAAITTVQEDLWRSEWEIMGEMQALQWRIFGPQTQGDPNRGYEEMAALRREMLAAMDDARARIDAILTAEQRERLRELSSCRR